MMDQASKKLVSHKVKTAAEIATAIGPRPREKKVIMCHGTFDIVHPGHVRAVLALADVHVGGDARDEHVRLALGV